MKNFPSDSDLNNLLRELSEGKEMAKELQNHLNLHSSSSRESREFLLQRIMHSYDQALSMLAHNEPSVAGGCGGEAPPPQPAPESPWPVAGSLQSDDSDQDFTDQAARKRKASARWSHKVKVGPEVGIEGQLDDGYGWRKYGQKDILGAKHPRGYYRCTYRQAHGCLATKQVQRSDEDPTIFEITYKRKHTCNRATIDPPAPVPDLQNEDPNPLTQNPQNEPPPFNIHTCLNPPFHSSSSSPINPLNNNIFSDRSNVLGNYYSNPTNDLNGNYGYGDLIPNLRHSDSELSPIIIGAITSTANSARLDPDFPFGLSGSRSGFDFGNSGH